MNLIFKQSKNRMLMLLLIVILFYLVFFYFTYFRNEKLDCNKLNLQTLCIETEISVKSDDWLRFIYSHTFPNSVVQNDELYIKSIKVLNKFANKTKETPYSINFVPLDKKSYEKTPFGSQNIGEFSITIPSLKKGDEFVVEYIGVSIYKIYINNKNNITNIFGHWNIPMYTYGNWKIEQSQIGGNPTGETSLNWIINGRLNWGGTFNVMSTSEFYNLRNGFVMMLITIAIGISTIIVGIYSIRTQKKLARDSAKELKSINDNIIKTNKETHLNKQLGLLISFRTELELIDSNLKWFEELLDKNQGPDHEMWTINPSIYLSELYNEVDGVDLGYIKEIVIWINQKISLINMYRKELKVEGQKVNINKPQIKVLTNNIKEGIKEILSKINDTRKILDKNIKTIKSL